MMNDEIRDLVDASIGAVEMLSPDFEGIAGVSRTQGQKKGKALAALDHFDGKSADEIPERLRDVVSAIYDSMGDGNGH